MKIKLKTDAHGMRRPEQVVDLDALPAATREQVLRLVEAAKASQPNPDDGLGRDLMAYAISIDEGDAVERSTLLKATDATQSQAFAALVNWIRGHANKA